MSWIYCIYCSRGLWMNTLKMSESQSQLLCNFSLLDAFVAYSPTSRTLKPLQSSQNVARLRWRGVEEWNQRIQDKQMSRHTPFSDAELLCKLQRICISWCCWCLQFTKYYADKKILFTAHSKSPVPCVSKFIKIQKKKKTKCILTRRLLF